MIATAARILHLAGQIRCRSERASRVEDDHCPVDLQRARLNHRNACPPEIATLRVADFFCGCGGTSEGLRLAGMDIVFGLDFEHEAAATYQKNFPRATFFERDILDVDPVEVEQVLGETSGPLVLSACAPCQPFSTFRQKSANSERSRSLLPALLPFVTDLGPDFVLVENVPGIQSATDGPLIAFVAGLRTRGYRVQWEVVDCQHYGVPQRRRRLVLLATRHGEVSIPDPTHGPGRAPVSTVAEWIADLPELKAGQSDATVANHVCGAVGELNLRRLRASVVSR